MLGDALDPPFATGTFDRLVTARFYDRRSPSERATRAVGHVV